MSSQRISRGFHRIAVFLAAIPLIVGVVLSGLSKWTLKWSIIGRYGFSIHTLPDVQGLGSSLPALPSRSFFLPEDNPW